MLNLLHKHDNEMSQQATIWNVPLPKLEDNPFQTRQVNDPEHVLGLAASIVQMAPSLPATRGLQQLPVGRLVRYADGHAWPAAIYEDEDAIANLLDDGGTVVELAFGHSRRLAFLALAHGALHVFREMAPQRAAEWSAEIDYDAASYATMPLLLMPLTDRQMWEHAIAENAQRRDLTAIEEAIAIQRARTDLGMTYEEAGKIFGKSRGAAANLVRLLQLPEDVQQLILAGQLTERHGRALLRLLPAPHLLAKIDLDDAGAMTVAALERVIGWIVAHRQPIAPAPKTGYARPLDGYGSNQHVASVRQCDPPVWPLDWTPAEPWQRIVGPCVGCQFFVQFNGDAGPRCAQVERDGCYDAKSLRWQTEQVLAQRAVVAEPMAEQAATADGNAAPPATGDATGVVATATVLAERVAGTEINWFTTRNYWNDAPAALLDQNLCNGERCPCFVVAYNALAADYHVRPDPAGAPNMCAGCTSKQRMANRTQELEHGDVQAHRARIRDEQAEAERLISEASACAAAGELWSNQPFLLDLAVNLNTDRSGIDIDDIKALRTLILRALASRSAKTWSASRQIWQLDRVRNWLEQLGLRGDSNLTD
jgi:ParB-like chromosome segregation protein Spo0J